LSPTEAPRCDDASGGPPEVVLASRLIRSIKSGLEAFVLDKREDSYDVLTRVLNTSGVRGLLLVKDLGPYVVVYLDRGALYSVARPRLEVTCAYAVPACVATA